MNMTRLKEYLRKEGWLLAALAGCILLCLFLSATPESGNAEEKRISNVLSCMAGAGQVEVAIYCQDDTPCGAVVVADGASDLLVQLRLTSAVTTLLGLDANRVAVYPREGGQHHVQSR